MVVGSNSVAVTKASDILPVLSKEFLDTEATREPRFTQKSDITYSISHNFARIRIYSYNSLHVDKKDFS